MGSEKKRMAHPIKKYKDFSQVRAGKGIKTLKKELNQSTPETGGSPWL